MPKSVTYLVAFTVVFTGLLTACSGDRDPRLQNKPVAQKSAESAFQGYWKATSKDSDDLFYIDTKDAEKNEVYLQGFNLKPYSGGALKSLLEPALLSVDGKTARTILSVPVTGGHNDFIEIEVELSITTDNRMLVSHGTQTGSRILEFFERIDSVEGARLFVQKADAQTGK